MRNKLVRALLLVALVAGNLAAVVGVASAAGSVVINEIHYNPADALDGDAEFLELHNPGDTPFDLSGASFSGFDLIFAQGVSLAPGQYAIVSPSVAIAEATWNVTPIAEFAAGGLSGGGEEIILTDAGGNVLDQVSYLDTAPWPGAPDGNGPSLELVNPTLDNNDPAHWAASLGDPTPASENSVFTEGEVPAIDNLLLTPPSPGPSDAVTVSVDINGATAAPTFSYVVGIGGTETSQSMTNAGGNAWKATIPAQAAGDLVRYRIDAGTPALPSIGDTINYLGYVVTDPSVTTNLPVLQWFVDPDEFSDMMENDFLTDEGITGVLAFDGSVVDNVFAHVRGGTFSRSAPKKNFKVELPDGYLLDMDGPYPVDEFALQAEWVDWTFTNALVAWEVWNESSLTSLGSMNVRVQQNGEFFGLYRYQQTYDGLWRDNSGYDDGELFKGEGGWDRFRGFDKKNPKDDDYSSIDNAQSVLEQEPSEAKTEWLYDNVNVPAMINFLALTALMRHQDQGPHNFYVYFDEETGRLWHLPWDLDQTWRPFGSTCGGDEFRTAECINDLLLISMWEVPEFQNMYWRRLQTLVDTYLPEFDLEDRRVEIITEIGVADATLEVDKWGRSNVVTSSGQAAKWTDNIALRRSIFASEPRLPGAQSDGLDVIINELHYNPLDSQAEFLELYNPTNEAIDLTGWSIDGVGLTIQPGTVLLPGSYLVFTDNDPLFHASYTHNIHVGGMYPGGLKGSGETVTLLDATGATVDVISYLDVAPWPTEPDGTGVSLSLIDPLLDNNDGTNWTASSAAGGTPGLDNDATIDIPLTGPVAVFASGDQGDESMDVIINGSVEATFTVAGPRVNIQPYEVPYALPVTSLRVAFTNNGGTTADRNLRVDRVVVGDTNFETEDPSVFGTDTYNGTSYCAPGNNKVEILFCNGYFEYDLNAGSVTDTTPPAFNDGALTIGAVTSSTAQISWTPATDDSGVAGYRLYVDGVVAVEPAGTSATLTDLSPSTLHQLQISAVDAAGNESTDGPTASFTTTDATGGGSVVVYAAGDVGDEMMNVIINGSVEATFTVAAPRTTALAYEVPFEGNVESLRVAFTNNGASGTADRNLRVDRVVVDDLVYETEDPSVFGSDVFNGTAYCVAGNFETEILFCNGYFEYVLGGGTTDEIPPSFDTPNLIATPASISIDLTWTPASDNVGVVAYRVFVNGGQVVEIIGTSYALTNLVPATSYDIAIQAVDEAGNQSTNGPSVTVATLPVATGTPIEIDAFGETGDENVELWLDGNLVMSWTAIGTAPTVLSHQAANAPETVEVHFTNDFYDPANGIDRTLIVDRITVDGEVFESEANTVYSVGSWTASTGCAAGFKTSQELNCNGFFQYQTGDNPPIAPVTVSSPQFDGKKLDFVLDNNGGEELVIVQALLSWPEGTNEELKKIKNEGSDIFTENSSSPLIIQENDWKSGSTGDRTLRIGDTDRLLFEFESDASENLASYQLTLVFNNGSTVELVP